MISTKYLIDLYGICIQKLCATHEVTAINFVMMGTVQIFDIYH